MWFLKSTTMPVIVRTMGIIQKVIDKHIKKYMAVPSYIENPQKIFLIGLLIFGESTINVRENLHQKQREKMNK